MSVSVEKLREYLNYDPDTGVFTWIKKSSKNVMAGSIAGTVKTIRANKDGLSIRYRYIKLENEYPAARVAWAMHYGEWPNCRVRFIDGDTLNLKIDNLVLSNSIQGDHDHSTSEGRSRYMKEYQGAFPDRGRNSQLERDFGIGLTDYIQMAVDQGNLCAICGEPEKQMRGGKVKALAVDHNHTTGAVRGLLCCDCNQALGKFQDSQTVLYAAIAYLDRHVVK
jgi:hypothetical protein